MSLATEVEMIRQAPLFNALAPSLRKLLCFSSESLFYEAGQVIFGEGDAADAAYIVLQGAVELSVRTPKGPWVVNRLGCNDILGETGLLGDTARTATATAASRVEALRITKDLFCDILRESPDAALQLSRALARRLAYTTAQLQQRMQGPWTK